MAEWSRRGLQILVPRFDSGRGLQPVKFGRRSPLNRDVRIRSVERMPADAGRVRRAGPTYMRRFMRFFIMRFFIIFFGMVRRSTMLG